MSIPRRDPNFTTDDLHKAAEKFHDAGLEYWEATHRVGLNLGAVIWLQMTDGSLVLFTRGEYRETIMTNIHKIGSVYQFGTAGDENTE